MVMEKGCFSMDSASFLTSSEAVALNSMIC